MTEQEGGAGYTQPWLLLALLFKHHQKTQTSSHTEFPAVGVLASDHQVSRMDESSSE